MNLEAMQRALTTFRELLNEPDRPFQGGMILGSGWGEAIRNFEQEQVLSFDDIPGLGSTGVSGHAGKILVLRTGPARLLAFQGRRHFYEGEGWTPVALPVFLLHSLHVPVLLLTNAAGGIRDDLEPGCLMALTDHLNMIHDNPLIGPHQAFWGERFPDLSAIYDPDLRAHLLRASSEAGHPVSEGVYLATSGPTYETPAEVRAFRTLGADAVGMSTVPEAILAHAAGMRVAGLSCISNPAAGLGRAVLTHAEVTETTLSVMPAMQTILHAFWQRLG